MIEYVALIGLDCVEAEALMPQFVVRRKTSNLNNVKENISKMAGFAKSGGMGHFCGYDLSYNTLVFLFYVIFNSTKVTKIKKTMGLWILQTGLES